MRIINSILTCRNIVRHYAPISRALSTSDHAAEAVASVSAQFAEATSETSRCGVHSIDKFKRSQKSFDLSPEEQKKINFLLKKSDFFSEVNNLTQSYVQTRVRDSNLEITGLPHDINLLEKKLIEQLSDIEILKFQLPLRSGTILGFQSPKEMISNLATSSNVSVQLSLNYTLDKALITAIGLTSNVRALQNKIDSMMENVLSESYAVPQSLLLSEEFSSLYKQLNKLPNTILTIDHGVVNVCTNNESNFTRVLAELDEFSKSGKDHTESITICRPRGEYIWNALHYTPSDQVDIEWRSFDGNTLEMAVTGAPSAVKKTIAEINEFNQTIQIVKVAVPTRCLRKLGDFRGFFGAVGTNVGVTKPTMKDPAITLIGPEWQVNATLMNIYYKFRRILSAEDFSKIDTSIYLTYRNHNELMYDENNLRIFSATFPEAEIEWKRKTDGSIDVKIRASLEDLKHMQFLLKRNRIIQFSSYENCADIAKIVSVLQQNGRLPEVDIEEKDDHVVIRAREDKDEVQRAYDVIHDAIVTQGYQCKRYATNGKLVVPGNLLEQVQSAADAYEVLVAFRPDPTKDDKLFIDIVGRIGNCELFTTFLDLQFSNLSRLNQTSANNHIHTSQLLQSYQKNEENGAFVLHYADLDDFRIGGKPEAVETMQNIAAQTVLTEYVPFNDEKMGDYLLHQIRGINAEFPEVQISIDTAALEIKVTGTSATVKEVTDRISRIVSQCGVFETNVDAKTFDNRGGRKKIFDMIRSTESSLLDEQVSSILLYDDVNNQVTLQMIGEKHLLRNMDNSLNRVGTKIDGMDKTNTFIKLHDSGLFYFNYLQSKLGVQNVVFNNNQMQMHSLWAPKVQVAKRWGWASTQKPPDSHSRKNWKLEMWGDKSKDVLKVKKTILNAMEDMNFHRLQLMIGENVGLTALRNATELAQSATADGQVKFFIEYCDEASELCYVNVFGEDSERVEDLVSKIKNFTPEGSKTVHINAHIDNFPIKNCWFASKICEEIDNFEDEVFSYFNTSTNVLTISGNPDLVPQYEKRVKKWLKTLTERSTSYSRRGEIFVKAKVKYEPYRDYLPQRWNRLAFSSSRKSGTISYAGAIQDVEEFEKYLSREVCRTIPTMDILDATGEDGTSGRKLKSLLVKLSTLYPGVFVDSDKNYIKFCGEESEVETAIRLVKEASKSNDTYVKNIFFKLRIGEREMDIPFSHVARVFVSRKFKEYWPELQHFIIGREITFRGPQKDIDECSDILGKMEEWTVPNRTMRSATLFNDHRQKDGTFRDSHFVPQELMDKLFIDRNKDITDTGKSYNKHGQVKLYGRPEDIDPLSHYLKKVLPQKNLARKTVPLTELQVRFLRSDLGWRQMFSHIDTVANSFSKDLDSVEIVGDPELVAQIVKNLEKFIADHWSVHYFPVRNRNQYWDTKRSCWASRDFPRTMFHDNSKAVFGYSSEITGIKKRLNDEDDKGIIALLKMTERDIWNMDIHHLNYIL